MRCFLRQNTCRLWTSFLESQSTEEKGKGRKVLSILIQTLLSQWAYDWTTKASFKVSYSQVFQGLFGGSSLKFLVLSILDFVSINLAIKSFQPYIKLIPILLLLLLLLCEAVANTCRFSTSANACLFLAIHLIQLGPFVIHFVKSSPSLTICCPYFNFSC